MSYETKGLTVIKDNPLNPLELETLRIQKLMDPKSPTEVLGDIALSSIIGGAIAGSTVLPRTEAITLELVAGTTEYADLVTVENKHAT